MTSGNEAILLTLEEVAEKLGGEKNGITLNSVKKFIRDNRLAVSKLSPNKQLVEVNELARFIKDSQQTIVKENDSLPKSDKEDNHNDEIAKINLAKLIADAEYERVVAETKVALAKHECESVEQAFKKIEDEKLKIKEGWDNLNKERATYSKQVENCTNHMNESNEHRRKSEAMKQKAEEKFKDIVAKEKSIIEIVQKAENLIKTLQECHSYYTDNIIEVVKEINLVVKSIYIEAQRWQSDKKLWGLQQYISSKLGLIEDLVTYVFDVKIPEGLIKPETPEQADNKVVGESHENP
jgi:chromosome segregation ATPase